MYKIGLTACPSHRFVNPSYGYRWQGFTRMVLLAGLNPSWAATLETALITRFKESRAEPGCQNEKPGGETLPSAPPVFVYCVFAEIEQHIQHRLARARRLWQTDCE